MICREPLGFVNFEGSQNGPDLYDRDESHIALIWPRRDRAKMGRYDGPSNSQNLTVRGITPPWLDLPPELFVKVNSNLTYGDNLNMRMVCRHLRAIFASELCTRAFAGKPPRASRTHRRLSPTEKVQLFCRYVRAFDPSLLDLSSLRCKTVLHNFRLSLQESPIQKKLLECLNASKLTTLSLKGWKLDDARIFQLVTHFTHLKKLDVSDCIGMSLYGLKLLFRCFPTLKTLKLDRLGNRYIKVGVKGYFRGMRLYAHATKGNEHSLRSLSLRGANLARLIPETEIFSHCFQGHGASLRQLDVSNSSLGFMQLDILLSIAVHLKELNVQEQFIDTQLFRHITALTQIQRLNLTDVKWSGGVLLYSNADARLLELCHPLSKLRRLTIGEEQCTPQTCDALRQRHIELFFSRDPL